MIPKECKRLAEVDFPIAEVSRHAAREKSIRHGHPSTLHLWWARRPLASSRAVLLALLLPDPCDPKCPDSFKETARKLLRNMQGAPLGWTRNLQTDEGLRRVVLSFIADFANWDNSADESYMSLARDLVKAAHPEETPLVVDPFAGGGSIPVEALRLGCDAFANDLNPVACLILKVMLEDIPRHGPSLADELRAVGERIEAEAEQELTALYPRDSDGAIPIAYLWARTVRCEAPRLRRRDSPNALLLAVPQAQAKGCAATQGRKSARGRSPSGFRDLRATFGQRGDQQHGGPPRGPRACAVEQCYRRSACAPNSRLSEAVPTWYWTRTTTARAGRH